MTTRKLYKSRSSAIRAARQECKRALGAAYEAVEGPDFLIHPDRIGPWNADKRWKFELRGPATECFCE